ncbi:hypothetical protein EUTSA_v10029451mg, partial [Eutrema salsugineum]
CSFCKDQRSFSWTSFSKHWQNDEINELEF